MAEGATATLYQEKQYSLISLSIFYKIKIIYNYCTSYNFIQPTDSNARSCVANAFYSHVTTQGSKSQSGKPPDVGT